MVDNFDRFPRRFVKWEFYFIQILDRKRSASSNNGRCIKSYFVDSEEYLNKRKDDMIAMAHAYDARIYIHPARRSKMQIALEILSYTADCIKTNSIDRMWRVYETVCWKNSWTEKVWIVDVDTKNKEVLYHTAQEIKKCRPYRDPDYIMPTVNGYHIIYKGWFDLQEYSENTISLLWDVHKNNPTLLYYKWGDGK